MSSIIKEAATVYDTVKVLSSRLGYVMAEIVWPLYVALSVG